MSIAKRKNANGGIYYYNTKTNKFASEAAYKKQMLRGTKNTGVGKIDAKFQARSGKPSKAVCSNYGGELRVQKTSTAGRNLRKCR